MTELSALRNYSEEAFRPARLH